MPLIAWETNHSVETDANQVFAWNYWTNIANWDDPPAEFELLGSFVAGTRGLTRLPGQEPLRWFIREVTPLKAATIEVSLDDAALSFEWRFDELPGGRTRLTQRISLQGEKADLYLAQVKEGFAENLPVAMRKMAMAMANASASAANAGLSNDSASS